MNNVQFGGSHTLRYYSNRVAEQRIREDLKAAVDRWVRDNRFRDYHPMEHPGSNGDGYSNHVVEFRFESDDQDDAYVRQAAAEWGFEYVHGGATDAWSPIQTTAEVLRRRKPDGW